MQSREAANEPVCLLHLVSGWGRSPSGTTKIGRPRTATRRRARGRHGRIRQNLAAGMRMVAVTGQHVTQGLTGVGLKAAFRPHEADDDLEHLRRLGVVGGEIHHEEICLPSANQLSSQAARN
jgi:hypothetical protein